MLLFASDAIVFCYLKQRCLGYRPFGALDRLSAARFRSSSRSCAVVSIL